MTDQYRNRINSVCAYILANLDEDLSLQKLGIIAGFSRFHFHRVFRAYTGVNVFSYVQLARMRRASFQLVFQQHLKVIDIAFDAGFDSPESFSRAFKRTFGQSPSVFRKNPDWSVWHDVLLMPNISGDLTMNVDIIDFEPTPIAVLEHHGSPALLNQTIATFISWRKAFGLSPVKTAKTYGIAWTDPNITLPDEFRFDVCGEVRGDIPDNPQGVKNGLIPGGRCAVVQHRGSHNLIDQVIHKLFEEWLPNSGQQVRDFPVFFNYVNRFPEVSEADLLTDIYLPIE